MRCVPVMREMARREFGYNSGAFFDGKPVHMAKMLERSWIVKRFVLTNDNLC